MRTGGVNFVRLLDLQVLVAEPLRIIEKKGMILNESKQADGI